jgi:hypothetical protein
VCHGLSGRCGRVQRQAFKLFPQRACVCLRVIISIVAICSLRDFDQLRAVTPGISLSHLRKAVFKWHMQCGIAVAVLIVMLRGSNNI